MMSVKHVFMLLVAAIVSAACGQVQTQEATVVWEVTGEIPDGASIIGPQLFADDEVIYLYHLYGLPPEDDAVRFTLDGEQLEPLSIRVPRPDKPEEMLKLPIIVPASDNTFWALTSPFTAGSLPLVQVDESNTLLFGLEQPSPLSRRSTPYDGPTIDDAERLVIASDGNLYVQEKNQISVWMPDGTFVNEFPYNPGTSGSMMTLAADGEHLILTEWGNLSQKGYSIVTLDGSVTETGVAAAMPEYTGLYRPNNLATPLYVLADGSAVFATALEVFRVAPDGTVGGRYSALAELAEAAKTPATELLRYRTLFPLPDGDIVLFQNDNTTWTLTRLRFGN
jgi:hypothetical protein